MTQEVQAYKAIRDDALALIPELDTYKLDLDTSAVNDLKTYLPYLESSSNDTLNTIATEIAELDKTVSLSIKK